jgi:hypothetical protein
MRRVTRGSNRDNLLSTEVAGLSAKLVEGVVAHVGVLAAKGVVH